MDQQISGATGETIAAAISEAETDALHDVAALLAEQLSACHAAAARCFAIANDEEDFQMPVRLEALKLATRLVQASAAAASAVKRVKGGEFHHHVTVQRIDYSAEKAARKAREKQAAKESGGDALRQIEERVQRVVEAEQGKLTPEEQATIDGIWAEAAKRPYPMSREEEPSVGGTAT
ncbi:MAG: hypothetical protein ACJ8IR_10340 [Alphaproteobacteria bacterium]|jgi:hypothetical protein